MPNLDPWINQNEATTKLENDLLSIRAERQEMIHPKSHPTYNDRQQKIIEMIDWTLEKYKTATSTQNMNQENEQIIIDNIMEELYKKRDLAIHKKKQAQLKDEVWKYGWRRRRYY